MPLVKPDTDKQVGKCGMPAIESGRTGGCDKPGVKRVAVDVDDGDNDYDYKYTSHFRAISIGPVMVDLCEEHDKRMSDDFASAERRVAARETEEAKAEAKIRELEDQLRAAKAEYPGAWREQ